MQIFKFFATILCIFPLLICFCGAESQLISFVVSVRGLPSGDNENVGSILTKRLSSLIGVKTPQIIKNAFKSDPYILISTKSGSNNKLVIDRSPIIQNNNDPYFNDVHTFKWEKGTNQRINFNILDHDLVDSDDFLGQASIDVDDYMANGQDQTARLTKTGFLNMRKSYPVYFRLSVRELPSMDQFGVNDLSDPYIVVSLKEPGKQVSEFHRTSSVDNMRDFDWKDVITFNGYKLGQNQELIFTVMDHDTVGLDQNLGEVSLNMDDFVKNPKETTLELPHLGGKVVVKAYGTNQ